MWSIVVRPGKRRITEPEHFKQVMTYDIFGRMTSMALPDTRMPYRYVYDNAGRLRFLLDASGQERGYLLYWTYDRTGRLQEIGYYDSAWGEPLLKAHASDPFWLPARAAGRNALPTMAMAQTFSRAGPVVRSEVAPDRVVEHLRYTGQGYLEERLTHLQTSDGEYRHAARFAYGNLGNIR